MNPQCAGLIFDDSIHFLDHLAPFCAQMDWPLIILDPFVVECCKRFYPMIQVIHTDFSQLPACIVSCNTRPSIELWLGPFSSWQGKVIWLPHGQSDKGWKAPYFQALGSEDLLLVYGARMRETLHIKGVLLPQVSIGHFRWQFYQTHASFYNNLMDSHFGSKEFILYAPTWNDSEQNSSLSLAFDRLIPNVPSHLHLKLKIHPNTLKASPARLESYRAKLRENVSLIECFPPIYPILSRTQAYIGDMSSIGYDYLRFNRPLFFLTHQKVDPTLHPSTFLMQAGHQIPYSEIPILFTNPLPTANHEALTQAAFDETAPEIIREQIQAWLNR